MGIDLAALQQLERLAALDSDSPTPGSREKLCDDLSRILAHVESLTGALAELPDTTPTAAKLPPLRADEPRPGLTREAALRGAPHTDDSTFVVPRIVP